jgi:serine/threonine-protein kinase
MGTGGMGEVYRALDTTLGRKVAIKILANPFAHDPDRLARFEREAKTLASLNHPNIAQIYGFEKADGIRALVMELVEGPTLADRVKQGPIAVDEALPVAKQIAEALEAAHEQGIVHRDLKPANIKLRSDGVVKVLDFGLAKALDRTGPAVDASQSPTITLPALTTGAGVLLGTAAYMSPEQAKGLAADKRTDIWAFGCVLYEMLTGSRAFGGDNISDTLANVLKVEANWSRLPVSVPPRVRAVLRACLQKDLKDRMGDAHSVRLALDGAFDAPPTSRPGEAAPAPVWWRALPWVAGTMLGGLLVGAASWAIMPPAARPVGRFVVTTSDTPSFSGLAGAENIAISPDGTRIVYRASAGGLIHLYVRRVDQLQGTSVFSAVQDFVANPVVSPDGGSVVFQAPDATWKKVSILGGPAVTIFPAAGAPRGASWGRDDTIFFSQNGSRIFRVRAAGGEPTPLTTLDSKQGEVAHTWPEVLPAGNAVLFTVLKGNTNEIAVLDLTTGERRTLLSGGSRPRYSPSGHLIYAVNGTLMAVPFDSARLQLVGNAVPVVEGVLTDAAGAAEFALSADGSLVYVAGSNPAVRRSLVWADRDGREEALEAPPRAYTSPRISPDGTKVALNLRDEENDIWIWDFARKTLTRLTFDPGLDRFPLWSPDGRRIAFSSQRDKSRGNPFWQAADGTGTVERLAESDDDRQVFPTSFSPDGTRLLVYGDAVSNPDDDDLAIVQVQGEGRLMPLLRTAFVEQNAVVSPDGRWLAYNSNESGRHEVYVRPFPDLDKGRWQVSTSGGSQPLWARDGRELFFRNNAALMAAAVQTDPGFAVGTPKVVFEGQYAAPQGGRTYDVSPDGRRFLMIKEGASTGDATPQAQIILIQNWSEELKRLLPTN